MITPAPAGTTQYIRLLHKASQDHPRACGDHFFPSYYNVISIGSPPRLRGPRSQIPIYRHSPRITPAPAGTTRESRTMRSRRRDHPRACGDHYSSSLRWPDLPGSPPRLRGPHQEIKAIARQGGITPAPAGTTSALAPPCPAGRDHPRACGDHATVMEICFWGSGSPPRLRGPPRGLYLSPPVLGITPAPAGTTVLLTYRGSTPQDHPRACGDHRKSSR